MKISFMVNSLKVKKGLIPKVGLDYFNFGAVSKDVERKLSKSILTEGTGGEVFN